MWDGFRKEFLNILRRGSSYQDFSTISELIRGDLDDSESQFLNIIPQHSSLLIQHHVFLRLLIFRWFEFCKLLWISVLISKSCRRWFRPWTAPDRLIQSATDISSFRIEAEMQPLWELKVTTLKIVLTIKLRIMIIVCWTHRLINIVITRVFKCPFLTTSLKCHVYHWNVDGDLTVLVTNK